MFFKNYFSHFTILGAIIFIQNYFAIIKTRYTINLSIEGAFSNCIYKCNLDTWNIYPVIACVIVIWQN